MSLPAIHRVVTGHDVHGQALISSRGALPTVVEVAAIPGTVFHEVWSTLEAPALISNAADPTLGPLVLSPPARGTRLRFVDIPADTEEFLANGATRTQAAFAQIGDAQASTMHAQSPHPLIDPASFPRTPSHAASRLNCTGFRGGRWIQVGLPRVGLPGSPAGKWELSLLQDESLQAGAQEVAAWTGGSRAPHCARQRPQPPVTSARWQRPPRR